jgi:hypothetical protein
VGQVSPPFLVPVSRPGDRCYLSPHFFYIRYLGACVRVLLICPIPLEYTTCRTALGLRDAQAVPGCRIGRGTVGSVDILAVETGPAKARESLFALRDFRRNARRCSQDLHRIIADALESGWFGAFDELWKLVPRGQVEKLPQRVLP